MDSKHATAIWIQRLLASAWGERIARRVVELFVPQWMADYPDASPRPPMRDLGVVLFEIVFVSRGVAVATQWRHSMKGGRGCWRGRWRSSRARWR